MVSCAKILVLKWRFMWGEENDSQPKLPCRQLWSFAGVSILHTPEIQGRGVGPMADLMGHYHIHEFLCMVLKAWSSCKVLKPPECPKSYIFILCLWPIPQTNIFFKPSKLFYIKWSLILKRIDFRRTLTKN